MNRTPAKWQRHIVGLPLWLDAQDFENVVRAFKARGFGSALNYYRNLDRNWELQQAAAGQAVSVPALFMIGERDTGLSIPGMGQIIAAMPSLVPKLQGSHVLPEAGHWLQQERPAQVSELLVRFLRRLHPASNRHPRRWRPCSSNPTSYAFQSPVDGPPTGFEVCCPVGGPAHRGLLWGFRFGRD
jgi:hypothetical protein